MDIARIISLVTEAAGSLTAATQLIEHIQKIAGGGKPDIVAIRELLPKLYQQIGQTQHKQLTMERALSDLQKELEKHDRFTEQAARYQLAKTDMGALVYMLKPAHENSEPPHAICATCYDDSQRSILQPSMEKYDTLVCPRCQSQAPKSYGRSSSGPTMPEPDPGY